MSLRSNSVTEERVLSRSKCSIDNICCGTGGVLLFVLRSTTVGC